MDVRTSPFLLLSLVVLCPFILHRERGQEGGPAPGTPAEVAFPREAGQGEPSSPRGARRRARLRKVRTAGKGFGRLDR